MAITIEHERRNDHEKPPLGDEDEDRFERSKRSRSGRSSAGESSLMEVVAELNNLGCAASQEGLFHKAKQYYEEVISKLIDGSKDKNHGIKEVEAVAVALTNLGLISEKVKNYANSIEYYERALQIYYRLYGPLETTRNTQIADLLNTLGTVCVKQQQRTDDEHGQADKNCYKKAHAYYSQALEIYKREHHGPHAKSIGLAQTLCNLGNLCFIANNTNEAGSYYRMSLFMYSRANKNNDHVPKEVAETMASLLNNLGSLCRQEKDFGDALDYYKQALNFEHMAYGGDSQNINMATTLSNCGDLSTNLGHFDEALRFYRLSLETFPTEKSYKDSIATILIRLGTTNLQMKNSHAAKEYYKEALSLYKTSPKGGSRALQEAEAWHNMGVLERKSHNVAAAASHQEKALDVLKEHLCGKRPSQSAQRLRNAIKSELINLEACQIYSQSKVNNKQSRFRLWPGTGRITKGI